MDVFETLQRRRTRGSHESTPVPKKVLHKLLEAARLSPSSKNLQPWHFVVVTEAERRKALSNGMSSKFLLQTPAVIVLCGNEKISPDWYVVDVALAGENMVIAATAEGLETCWVSGFDENQVKKLLEIPEDLRVVALLAVGYAKEKSGIKSRVIRFLRKRKALNEIASWEVYGHKFDSDN